jgi:hypothetical protein
MSAVPTALDEVHTVLLSPALKDGAVAGFGDALHREMLSGVGSDRSSLVRNRVPSLCSSFNNLSRSSDVKSDVVTV